MLARALCFWFRHDKHVRGKMNQSNLWSQSSELNLKDFVVEEVDYSDQMVNCVDTSFDFEGNCQDFGVESLDSEEKSLGL